MSAHSIKGRIDAVEKRNLEHLLKVIRGHVSRRNAFPSLDFMERWTKRTKPEVLNMMARLVELGYLKEDNGTYSLIGTHKPEPPTEPKPTDRTVDRKKPYNPRIAEAKKNPTPKQIDRWESLTLWMIRIVLLLVGIGASYMSVYYTRAWLTEFLSSERALLLSSIMVLFSVTVFEVIVYFARDKRWALGTVFSVVWGVVLFFSMMSTVAGQYNARMATVIVQTEQQTEAEKVQETTRLLWDSLDSEESDLERERDQLEREIDGYLRQIETYPEEPVRGVPEYQAYLNTQWRKTMAERRVREIRERLAIIRQDKREFIETTSDELKEAEPVTVRFDFYDWISGVLGIDRSDLVQFWISVFPAVFIDVIAPMSLAVVMFLKRKEE